MSHFPNHSKLYLRATTSLKHHPSQPPTKTRVSGEKLSILSPPPTTTFSRLDERASFREQTFIDFHHYSLVIALALDIASHSSFTPSSLRNLQLVTESFTSGQ